MARLFLFFSLALGASSSAANPTPEQLAFFEAKVRPVLSDNCYKCHSVEQGKSKGDLTLDTREGWQKGGEGGAAITPGDPSNSLLITAISYHDPDLQMPPKGEQLSAQQIADLTSWVQMGAPDPRDAKGAVVSKLSGLTDKARHHWAYQPVKKPEVPANKGQQWSKTPVDAFILQKLEANGMLPNKPASKEALIRRATYDLTGLPPTPQEVIAFLQDGSPNAFAKVVDRLLASPHYGERWGRHWLDTARYSDTTGGEKNAKEEYRYPHAWTYRDYVIQSFNDDKPYDQFIREQVAGDQLPGADSTKLAALGFLTVGQRFRNPNDVINDRIDVVSKGLLGLTVTCARCHDHMFDPIPTADYYSLHGIFASTLEQREKPLIAKPVNSPQLLDFQAKHAALEQQNRDIYYRIVASENAAFRQKAGAYLLAARFGGRKDIKAADVAERNKLIRKEKLDEDTVLMLARITRRRFDPVFGPFVDFAALPEEGFADKATELAVQVAKGGDRRRAINPLVAKAFENAAPKSIEEVAAIYAKLFTTVDAQAKAFVDGSAKAATELVPGFTSEITQLAKVPYNVEPAPNVTSDGIKEELLRWPPKKQQRSPFLFAKLNELELTHPGAPAHAMAVTDAKQPRNSPIFIRGEAQSRGEIVPRRFLEILSNGERPEFKLGSGRLELADAIASKQNPLTARVMANRIWMHHFGEGLVTTPDDLGVQSAPPSHPELLDYLAAKFMEFGWSLKQMHRLVMLSNVYQQSSETNPAYEQKDPDNRLLWRANIRRLDFESVRDSLLLFSGRLDRTLGGKPVNLTDEPYSNRRSVYGYIDRGNLPELMQSFDFSDPDMPNSKRTSTVVPQQALFLMNSPFAVDVARKLVTRPEFTSAPNDTEKLRALYRILYQRYPSAQELYFAQTFLVQAGPKSSTDLVQASFTPEDSTRGEMRRANAKQQLQKRRQDGRTAIQNSGDTVERKPLTPWERLAQALLFTNEVAYVN